MSSFGDRVRWVVTGRWSGDDEVREARPGGATALAGPANAVRRGYEIGIPAQGLNEYNAQADATGTDRSTLLSDFYDAFIACPWSWAAVNAISKTITGGGVAFTWDNDDGEGDQDAPSKPAAVLQCERLLRWCNPREDIIQLLRGVIADLLVFGDAFIEVAWAGGIPVALYSLDCPSTTPLADDHGNVTGYVQVTPTGKKARFEPHEVIHISLDAPRSGIFGVAPTYAAMLPMKVWLFASATLNELFRKGLPATIHADLAGSTSEPEMQKWLDKYMSRNIGPKNIGRPIVTKGGGVVRELQASRIEEILHTLDQQRDVILSTYGVPPAEAGVIESGNLGGGTGESQRKSFLVNTCQPIAALVLEKLNFVLLQAFGITGWSLDFNEVDMRDSKTVEDIADQRIRNGTWTLNRRRAEIGEPAVDGGDIPILVDRTGVIAWRDMDATTKAQVAKLVVGTDFEPEDPGGEDTPLTLVKSEKQPVPDALAAAAGLPPGHPAAPTPPGVAPSPVPTAPDDEDEDDTEPATTGKGKKAKENGRPVRPLRESWPNYRARLRAARDELDRAA